VSSFGGIERNVSRFLGRFPVTKKIVKYIYSRLVFIKAKKSFRYQSLTDPVSFKKNNKSSFFGYYDKSPENAKGLVLCLNSDGSTSESPSAVEKIELVVFDNHRQPLFCLQVSAYNWQQGCRAQWLTDDRFIFNDFATDKDSYVAHVYSVERLGLVRTFERPVQDSFGTEYFISLSYPRLMSLRPDYGYRNLPSLTEDELDDVENDGLWRVDYESGDSHLLVSLADACKINPVPEFRQAFHKFNHVMISPDGSRFIVMHRYFVGQRRIDRLLLADANSGELELLNDYGMISHCFWADANTILGFMRGPRGKDDYWLVNVNSGDFTPLLQDKLSHYGDGHPHVYGDWFVTDTYPDKARMQHLLLCNWRTGEVKEIGEFSINMNGYNCFFVFN
jgi:hypothetical protein